MPSSAQEGPLRPKEGGGRALVSCDAVHFTLVEPAMLLTWGVELTMDERTELTALLNSGDVPATVATRARIVLWHAEQRPKKDIAVLASVSRPTVDLWIDRYEREGLG